VTADRAGIAVRVETDDVALHRPPVALQKREG
jgi:hypothetical protein